MATLELGRVKGNVKAKGLSLPHRGKPVVVAPFVPGMPNVNLLPPRVFDAAQAKMAQRKVILIGGVVALVLAGGYAAQSAQIMVANGSLDTETTKSAGLTAQVNALKPVKAFYDGVAAQKVVVRTTMARELFYSRVASALLDGTVAGVRVETMTVSAVGGATGAACPLADPFATAPSTAVTCVQFTGTAPGREALSTFLTHLGTSDDFVNPYVPVTDSADGKQVTFNGSVGITNKFFSNRYADDAYLLKGVGAAK
ncbi:PilN domain-containing protein [Tessaracoccus sp.]